MGTLGFSILLLSMLQVEEASQQPLLETGPICLGQTPWPRLPEDVRAIETAPVPESYRRLFESTRPCARWGLSKEALVEWHLAFGSEDSTRAALAYLEADYMKDLPPPGDYRRAIEQAREAAQGDRRRLAALPPGSDARLRFERGSQRLQRLDLLEERREDYRFLVEHYLQSAEEFGSIVLLARAEQFLEALLQVRDPDGDPAAREVKTDAISLRIAVLRAQLSPSPRTISQAEAVIAAVEQPSYAPLAEHAYSGGGDFCDISTIGTAPDGLEDVCNSIDDVEERVIPWAVARAALDLLRGMEEQRTDERALQLLQRKLRSDNSDCCGRHPRMDLLRLHLARAGLARTRLIAAAASNDFFEMHEPWTELMQELRAALDLVPPADEPARFARLAGIWLADYERSETGPPPPPDTRRLADSPPHRRFAAYLRHLLPSLPAVAAGDGGIPARR